MYDNFKLQCCSQSTILFDWLIGIGLFDGHCFVASNRLIKIMSTIVLILPCYMQVCLIQEWLDVESVARLDSSVCSTKHREEYLSALSKSSLYFINPDAVTLNWISKRQVKIELILIDLNYRCWDDKCLAHVHSSSCRLKVAVGNYSETDYSHDQCAKFKSVLVHAENRFEGLSLPQGFFGDDTLNERLRTQQHSIKHLHIVFSNSSQLLPGVFEKICYYCPNLEKLDHT